MVIRIERIDRSGDGAENRAEAAPADPADGAVISRVESRSYVGPSVVATSFRPVAARPSAYPVSLPFVPYAETHTTEYPDSDRAPRARWVTVSEPHRVFDEIARQSVAAGWHTDPGYHAHAFQSAVRLLFLRRDRYVRRISQYEFEGTSLIELEDVPLRSP